MSRCLRARTNTGAMGKWIKFKLQVHCASATSEFL